MTTEHDEPTEKDLDADERRALKLARLPEAKLRALSIDDLRKAYEYTTADFFTGPFLTDEDHRRVAKVWDARGDERRPKRAKRSAKTKRRDGGYLKL